MRDRIPHFLLETAPVVSEKQGGKLKESFIDKGLVQVGEVIRTAYLQWEFAARTGFFQQTDPRIKILFLVVFAVIISLKREVYAEFLIALFLFMIVAVSRLSLTSFYKRVFFFSFFFGFLIALPSSLNLITKGDIVIPLFHLSQPHRFWIYQIPAEIGITREGLLGVCMLSLRVMNSLSLALLVLFTTPLPEIIKALKVLKVPDVFLMILFLSYKYIFVFAKTLQDIHLAKKSRLVGKVRSKEGRQWIAGRMAFIFRKTQRRCEEVFKAMVARGFSQEIRLHQFKKLTVRDHLVGCGLFGFAVLFLAL